MGKPIKSLMVHDRDQYILDHAPTVLVGVMAHRTSTKADMLVDEAISAVGRIWDIIQGVDTPAHAMVSQSIDGNEKP